MTWRWVSTITITQFGVNCGTPPKLEEPQFAQFGAKFGCCDPRDAVERLKKWRVRAVGYWISPCKWGVFVDDYFWGLEVVSRVLNSGNLARLLNSGLCPMSSCLTPCCTICLPLLHWTITPYHCIALHYTILLLAPYHIVPYHIAP